MKTTVVVPTFNEEYFLPKTLESLKRLDLQPDEILVVDSNSSDKTRDVAKKYGAKVVIEKARGIGLARQRGLEAATGDFVAFTDADTVVPHDWLTKIVTALQKPDTVGVYGGVNVEYGWLPYRIYLKFTIPILLELHQLFGLPMPPGQNMAMWKEAAIKAGGYPTHFKIGEDIEMARRLAKIGKVAYLRDNYVISSGRRGNEGWPMVWRTSKFYLGYLLFHHVGDQTFPDMR